MIRLFCITGLSLAVPFVYAEAPKPAATAPAPAAPKAVTTAPQETPADFPFTLQGFFGVGDRCQAALRDKATGRSEWVKPGKSLSGWKLESAEAKTGVAVLSRDGRRITLRVTAEVAKERVEEDPDGSDEAAGDAPKTPADSGKSTIEKRAGELYKNPGFKRMIDEVKKAAESQVRREHPELYADEATAGQRREANLLEMEHGVASLKKMNEDDAHEASVILESVTDARRANPPPEIEGGEPLGAYEKRVMAEADRNYRQRTAAGSANGN